MTSDPIRRYSNFTDWATKALLSRQRELKMESARTDDKAVKKFICEELNLIANELTTRRVITDYQDYGEGRKG